MKMRLITFVLSFGLFQLTGLSAVAQFSIGVRAGLGFTGFTGKYTSCCPDDELGAIVFFGPILTDRRNALVTSIMSAQAGLVFKIGLRKGLALVPEINYYNSGANLKHDLGPQEYLEAFLGFASATQAERIRFGYIGIPVLLHIQLPKKFSIQAGPYLGIRIAQSRRIFLQSPEKIEKQTGDFTLRGQTRGGKIANRFYSADIGFAVGVGYQFSNKWAMDMRYQHSLRNIIHNKLLYGYRQGSNHKIHALNIGVSYYLF